jgi:hypothetical protein
MDTSAMRPLLSPDDQQFWYETLRALGLTAYGGADFGEVVTTAARISAGDYGSRYEQWAATAERVEAEARGQLAAGHQVSARDGLLRAATYFRSAEFFTPRPRPGPARAGCLPRQRPLLRRRRGRRPLARPAPSACCAPACSTGSMKPWPDPGPGPHPAGHNHPPLA